MLAQEIDKFRLYLSRPTTPTMLSDGFHFSYNNFNETTSKQQNIAQN